MLTILLFSQCAGMRVDRFWHDRGHDPFASQSATSLGAVPPVRAIVWLIESAGEPLIAKDYIRSRANRPQRWLPLIRQSPDAEQRPSESRRGLRWLDQPKRELAQQSYGREQHPCEFQEYANRSDE